MKIAILSVSSKGNKLALNLLDKLSNDSTVILVNHFHKNIKSIINEVFENYDAIIAIMASGIIIRSIAPYIKSKNQDPAVINIDDNGKFVVSMLSGHLGGANKLSYKIADLISATPVITTSTDVNNYLGIDTLANDLYFSINDYKKILPINKSILEGRKLTFKINPNSNFNYLYEYLNNNTLEIDVSFEKSGEIPIDVIDVEINNNSLRLEKQKIIVGIGCRKGKTKEEIELAIKNALSSLKLTIDRLDLISSADIKRNEKGLLELSKHHNIPITFIETELLKNFNFDNISSSEFVKSKFGIGGVCEPSALIAAGENSKLIYKKTAFNGVTVAIALSNAPNQSHQV